MKSLSKEIAARATTAKFGGEPDIRALARDLLAVLAELDDARDHLATIRHAEDCPCNDCDADGGVA